MYFPFALSMSEPVLSKVEEDEKEPCMLLQVVRASTSSARTAVVLRESVDCFPFALSLSKGEQDHNGAKRAIARFRGNLMSHSAQASLFPAKQASVQEPWPLPSRK